MGGAAHGGAPLIPVLPGLPVGSSLFHEVFRVGGQIVFERGHTRTDLEVETFMAKAPPQGIQGLEKMLGTALFPHLANSNDVEPEGAGNFHMEGSRHVLP